MNTIAEHRRVLVEDVRRQATLVTRLVETQPRSRLLIHAAIGVILFLSPALRAEAADKPKVTDLGYAKITDLMTKDLVIVPPGKEVTMITVEYAPGAADPVHRHDAQAFVYVLEGSIEMQMKGAERSNSSSRGYILRGSGRNSSRRKKCQRYKAGQNRRLAHQGKGSADLYAGERMTQTLPKYLGLKRVIVLLNELLLARGLNGLHEVKRVHVLRDQPIPRGGSELSNAVVR